MLTRKRDCLANNFIFVFTPLKIEKTGEAKFSVFIDEKEKPILEHKLSFISDEQTIPGSN